MRIAEWLYTNGFISYPRTDNTVYPPSIDLRALTTLFTKGAFAEEAKKLLQGKMVPTRGKRSTTDHPPIYPTVPVEKSDLKDDEWKIYELVVRRFFATLAEQCVWDATASESDMDRETLRASGARLIEAGWRYYYPYSKAEEHILPELKKGERLKVLGHVVEAKETQPPARFGQGKLIKIMDDLGLGTKSTRHDIISKLYARAYVQGNPMRPTNTAYAVVDTLQKYAPTITKPEMTQTLEKDMTRSRSGRSKKTRSSRSQESCSRPSSTSLPRTKKASDSLSKTAFARQDRGNLREVQLRTHNPARPPRLAFHRLLRLP